MCFSSCPSQRSQIVPAAGEEREEGGGGGGGGGGEGGKGGEKRGEVEVEEERKRGGGRRMKGRVFVSNVPQDEPWSGPELNHDYHQSRRVQFHLSKR